MSEKYAIGIDLGGTNLRVALVSESGKIIRKVKKPSSERIVDTIADSINEIRRNDRICGIGLGVAGLIDRKNSRVLASPNLRAVGDTDAVGELRRRLKMPVFIENDANAAALGERMVGAGRDFEDFVLLTLGTGIGSGIIHRGRVLEVPAELGHISINFEAEKCPCGNTGCLENYASARAMIARAVSMLEKGAESLLKECCKGSFYKLTPEDIYGAALDGDNLSREILKDAGRYLGVGLANIINVLGPEAIILAGGLTGAWNIYVQEAIREASRRAFKDLFDRVKIIPSSLEDNAGIIGSACLVFSNLPEPLPSKY